MAARVSAAIRRIARARASRAVSALAVMSTMRACPSASRWLRPANPTSSLDMPVSGGRPGRFRSVAQERLHPVLGDELELLQLASTPLLVRGQKLPAVQIGQLLLVVLVVLP